MFNETLISCAIRSFVVLLAAAAIAALFHRRSAAVRHHVWTIGLLGCLVVPILGLLAPPWRLPLLPATDGNTRIVGQILTGENNANDQVPLRVSTTLAANESAKPLRAMPRSPSVSTGKSLAPSPNPTASERTIPVADASLVSEASNSRNQSASLSVPALEISRWTTLTNIAGWVWLAIVCLFGVRIVVRWLHVRRMLSACEPMVDERTNQIFDDVCVGLNLNRRPRLLSTSDTVSPWVAGVSKPSLVMPDASTQWTEINLRMVFTHELAHITRRDILVQSLGDLACTLNWFNPLAWYASTQMRSLREIACDDLVVMRFRQPADYADVLMRIAKACRHQSLAMTVSMARTNSVSERLLSIVDGSRERASLSGRAAGWTLAVSMILIGVFSVVQPIASAQAPSDGQEKQGTQELGVQASENVGDASTTKTMRVRVVSADGKPIANADVLVSIWEIERTGDFPTKTYHTDGEGEVAVSLPRKMRILRLWPSKPGYVAQFLNFADGTHDDGESIPGSYTFYLERGERLGGTVVDSAGQPIAGASVQVRVDVSEPPWTSNPDPMISTWLANDDDAAVTDHEGRWEILNAPAKKDGSDYEFRLQVTHPEFAGDTRWGELQAKQGVRTEQLRAGTAEIKLNPGLRLRGQISGPNGQPVTEGLVIWDDRPYWAEGDNEASIDQSGNYRSLPLSPGTYPVTVVAPGFAPQQVNVDLEASSKELNFTLKAGNPIVLEIVDQDGQPVPDAYVGIGEWRGTEAIYNHKHPNVPESGIPRQSDSGGIYRWEWAPEDAVVYSIGKKGFVNTEVALVARKQPHRIEMSPMMKIYGAVTDKQTKQPIRQFSVVPVKAFRPNFYSTDFQDRLQAIDGEYEILIDSDGQTGNRYMVRIEAEGYRTAFSTKSMEVGDAPIREDFQLEPAPAVRAEVENPDGTRAHDFMVAVGTPTTAPHFRIKRPDSNFGIAIKISGTSRFELPATFEPQLVRIFNELGFAEIHLESDESLGKIRLQPWAKVSGRLMQGDKPIANESIYFRPLVQRGLTEARFQDSFYTQTDPEGNFEFDRLPPMAGRIQAHLGPWSDSPMTSSQSLALDLRPGETRNIQLGSEGGRVIGKVVATGRDNEGLSKQWSLNFLVSRTPGLSLPEGAEALNIASEQTVDASVLQSDDFDTWLGTKRHHFVKLSEDGSLQIDGVPPGQYDLVIQLYEQPAGCLVETIGQKIVPISIESESNTIDLAKIQVECRSGPRVGTDMRSFQFIDAESRERNVNEMKGRYVLFHVWASWCAPCIASMPNLKATTDDYQEKPLTVVGLNVDDAAQQPAARSLAQDGKWNWAMNYLGSDSAMMKQLAVSSVPAYYLIGPDGKLVMSSNQWTQVSEALNTELTKQPRK